MEEEPILLPKFDVDLDITDSGILFKQNLYNIDLPCLHFLHVYFSIKFRVYVLTCDALSCDKMSSPPIFMCRSIFQMAGVTLKITG